jgi:spore maturation protein CgeD
VPPLISCLLTSYNRPLMLAEAIESVLAQTMQDFELIILDDNSGDPGVAEVISRHWHDPHTAVIKSSVTWEERLLTARYATMINLGLAAARGRYITYLTDDDLYLPRRFEVMAAALDAGRDVVYGSQQIAEEGPDGWRYVTTRHAHRPLTQAACVVDHCSVMHTAEAAAAAGGWDDAPEHWPQADARFWERLNGAGYVFWPVDEVTDVHRLHARTVGALGGPY